MQAALMETVNAPITAISDSAWRVRQALIEQGLETPRVSTGLNSELLEQIEDPGFGVHFLDTWFSPATIWPGLREALLGQF